MRGQEAGVLFVLGAARSGTSLLYKALCLHPDAAYFNNYMRRLPDHPSATVTNRIARRAPGARRRIWFSSDNAYVYSRRRSLRERLFPMPVEGEPIFAACGIPETPGTSDPTEAQVRALRRAVTGTIRWGGGSHFVNKRIANIHRIALLAKAFPEARFVDLTRDGRAVAYSLAKVDWWESSVVWWYGDTPRAWQQSGRDPWELCARNWVNEVQAIDDGVARLDSDRVFRLTYEHFTEEPVQCLRELAAFAGLRQDEGWLTEVERFDFTTRNPRWRSELNNDVIARIEEVQSTELARHGYR